MRRLKDEERGAKLEAFDQELASLRSAAEVAVGQARSLLMERVQRVRQQRARCLRPEQYREYGRRHQVAYRSRVAAGQEVGERRGPIDEAAAVYNRLAALRRSGQSLPLRCPRCGDLAIGDRAGGAWCTCGWSR